jgi:hypothetical protein
MFINEIFIVLGKRFKSYKNPFGNPDLPIDFKNLNEKNPPTERLRFKSSVCD